MDSPSHDKIASYVTSRALAAATAETIDKPGSPPNVFNSCYVTADADCYYRRGGTAVANVTDIIDGTASIFLPARERRLINWVDDGATTPTLTQISIISTAGGNVTFEWFR